MEQSLKQPLTKCTLPTNSTSPIYPPTKFKDRINGLNFIIRLTNTRTYFHTNADSPKLTQRIRLFNNKTEVICCMDDVFELLCFLWYE